MQGERFLSVVWRINALLILGVGVLAAVVLSVGAYHMYSDVRRPRNVDDVAATSPQDVDNQHVELGPFQQVPGAGVLRAPLAQMQTCGVGAITKSAGSTIDYLYVDPATRSSHWLRPSKEGLILRAISVTRHGSRGQAADTVVEVCAIVEQDSNRDARLSQRDRQRIAVSGPKGRGLRVIVDAADRLLDARMVDDDRVLVLYMLASRAMAAEMDARTPHAPVRTHELASLARWGRRIDRGRRGRWAGPNVFVWADGGAGRRRDRAGCMPPVVRLPGRSGTVTRARRGSRPRRWRGSCRMAAASRFPDSACLRPRCRSAGPCPRT